ncbi:MAG: hypothetical protein KC572_02005 [Gammaproteobacteria bacterium]|nr:hypothetical protein [Gammaproteobacteria bacterium]
MRASRFHGLEGADFLVDFTVFRFRELEDAGFLVDFTVFFFRGLEGGDFSSDFAIFASFSSIDSPSWINRSMC